MKHEKMEFAERDYFRIEKISFEDIKSIILSPFTWFLLLYMFLKLGGVMNSYFFDQAFGDLPEEDREDMKKLVNGVNKWKRDCGLRPWIDW